MDDELNFKYFHIPVEHHQMVRDYLKMIEEMNIRLRAENEAHKARMTEYLTQFKEKQRAAWTKLCEAAEPKVDAATSWDKPNWHIEGNYLDHGFAALTTFDMPVHPLAAMMGQQSEKEVEGVPEGETIN